MDYCLVGLAVALEHIVLASTDLGLGTRWIAGFDEERVKEILGVPKGTRVVALTPIEYPAEKEGIRGSMIKVLARSGDGNRCRRWSTRRDGDGRRTPSESLSEIIGYYRGILDRQGSSRSNPVSPSCLLLESTPKISRITTSTTCQTFTPLLMHPVLVEEPLPLAT